MSVVLLAIPALLAVVVAWELAAQIRRRWRARRQGEDVAPESREHHELEAERRRRLDVRAGRWPGAARW